MCASAFEQVRMAWVFVLRDKTVGYDWGRGESLIDMQQPLPNPIDHSESKMSLETCNPPLTLLGVGQQLLAPYKWLMIALGCLNFPLIISSL